MSLTNGNADVERSLSDKKSLLTVERMTLSDQTFEVRRIKEYVRHCDDDHKVATSSKEITRTIRVADSQKERNVNEKSWRYGDIQKKGNRSLQKLKEKVRN